MKDSMWFSIPPSKSILNRLLIIQSFSIAGKNLDLNWCSNFDGLAEDSQLMIQAIKDLHSGIHSFNVGQAGTVLRFLAIRLSRETGTFTLYGHPRLFERPQAELALIIEKLGGQAKLFSDSMTIISRGWKPVDELVVAGKDSSQFLSAVLLSAWNLDFDLNLRLVGNLVSASYLEMTVNCLKKLGMEVKGQGLGEILIPKKQSLSNIREDSSLLRSLIEPDMSSLFAVLAAKIVSQPEVEFFVPSASIQPDHEFTQILEQVGHLDFKEEIQFESSDWQMLHWKRRSGQNSKLIKVDLNRSPDLAPVLAVVLAILGIHFQFIGAQHLVHKESNRIQKTAELLSKIGFGVEINKDGFTMIGKNEGKGDGGSAAEGQNDLAVEFDADHDHRMAMAAGIAMKAGYKVKILGVDSVKKSLPDFWKLIGVSP